MRQGCILSLHIFNIYSEVIIRNILEGFEGTVKIGGRSITNLRYADDIVLVGAKRVYTSIQVKLRLCRPLEFLCEMNRTTYLLTDKI